MPRSITEPLGERDPRAVVQRARELVELARRHGYRTDELVQIIQDLG